MFKQQTNMLPIVKWGLKLLRDKWSAVPTDKDGGFCIEDFNTLTKVHRQLLDSDVYEEVAQHSININTIRDLYCKCTFRIEKVTGTPGIGASLRRSLRVEGATLRARLGLTCKNALKQARWNIETSTNAADGFLLASVLGLLAK